MPGETWYPEVSAMCDQSVRDSASYGEFCFLCHCALISSEQSLSSGEQVDGRMSAEEDVIPKWLLRKYELGDSAASLPNGQLRKYGQRKVPCCFACNQRMSQELERPVATAVADGANAVRRLEPRILLMWLAKLYYGTKFFEIRFRQDVSDSTSPLILEHSELLERNEYLRRLLLAGPQDVYLATPPASVFIFRAGVPEQVDARFDFFVSAFHNVDMIAVRMGEVFAVGVFGDNGHWASEFGGVRLVEYALSDMALHPAQCTEVTAWLGSLLAGHDAGGPWDLITMAESPAAEGISGRSRESVSATPSPGITTIFRSNFSVTKNDAPAEMIHLMRVNSLLDRLGMELEADQLQQVAEGAWRPTLLLNVRTDEPVQANCFEPVCPDLFRRAGWIVNLPRCPKCGVEGGSK